MSSLKKSILNNIDNIINDFQLLTSDDEIIELINQIKLKLHYASPLKNEPVDCVLWVKNNMVHSNDYNPNSVAPPEMKLLHVSIKEDGYTQPIVTMLEDNGMREVVDGFHRHRVGKEFDDIKLTINPTGGVAVEQVRVWGTPTTSHIQK